MSFQRLRIALTGLALAGAGALAACTTPAPPPPPPPPPPPAAPLMGPPIALSTAVAQDAAVFQAYLAKVAAISPNFTSGDDVALALTQGESISPDQLLRGEVAYAAIMALQDPNFVANVRAFGGDPQGRQEMISRLLANPDYAVAFGGADTAAGLAMASIIPQARKAFEAGGAVKQAAYDVQHQAWSKLPVADRPQRLANAKNAAMAVATAPIDDVNRLHDEAVGARQLSLQAHAAKPPYSPVIVRELAVAALAALGAAGDENLLVMAPLMRDAPTSVCLNTAKLNLYQCLAVARPHYEDIFCLGQHAMTDTSQCMMIAAGIPAPVVAPLPPLPVEAPPAAKPARAKHRRH